MLFVSRCVGREDYAVYDTEDGTEEIISYKALLKLVHHKPVDIKGISYSSGGAVRGIKVYQHPDYITGSQSKLSLLHSVQILTFKNIITGIRWDASRIQEPVSIRLSDFGSCCADRLLWGNLRAGRHVLTLILDDKLKISKNVFSHPGYTNISSKKKAYGVVFDLRQLTNVDVVYSSLIENSEDISILGNIRDIPERKDRMHEKFWMEECLRSDDFI